MIDRYSVLSDLLELVAAATGADAVEVWLADDAGVPELVGAIEGQEPIGPVPQDGKFSSIARVPVSGPSAEMGWVVAAHRSKDRFDAAAGQSLEQAARLIENSLDRAMERQQFDELAVDIRRYQNELHLARDQLEVSNRELEQFAYIAAHELVAPLRSVAIYAEVLASLADADGQPLTESGDYAAQIRAGVTRMTEQVQHLLALSQSHHEGASLEPVSVVDAVRAALDTLAPRLDEIDAAVEIGVLPVVAAREVPLQSVFANLLTNAIRYRRPDQQLKIHIDSEVRPQGPRITVTDNGEGIERTDRGRVFEMFERASNTQDGSGIGLALSRRILDAFGAQIGVDDNEFAGSTFWLQFPNHGVNASPAS